MRSPASPSRTAWGLLGAVWGFAGVAALLVYAIWRLAPLAWAILDHDLSLVQAVVLAVWVAFMLGAEGYRGFQRAFSPRVAARCRHLREHPSPSRVALAPLFVMAFFGAPRRRRISAFALTTGVVLLVVLVQELEPPWRNVVDVGVVLGLTYGLATLCVFWLRAMTSESFDVSPEVVG